MICALGVIHLELNEYIYIYIYIDMCVCVCVCVKFFYVRARSRLKHIGVMTKCVRNEILTLGIFFDFIV
jgi:hypothetical protein